MNLKESSIVQKPDLTAQSVPLTPDFYQKLDQDFDGFRSHVLIGMHSFTQDWGVWEKHPKGDETVILLAGSAEMVLKKPEGESSVMLQKPGDFVIVPAGVWHTARIAESAQMLFVTPGEGTDNQENPENHRS